MLNFSKRMKFLYFLIAAFATFSHSANIFANNQEDEYTINYTNVSIIEYINFVSKICNKNFIYNKDDLNFTVSIVSKDPITPNNVMSSLIQVLRINNLSLIEEDNSLIINKNDAVKEVAALVTEKNLEEVDIPIITRIFSLKNAKIASISAILKPMISQNALLELYPENNLLIVTDITANVAKIENLIEAIDATESPIQIETFTSTNHIPSELIALVKEILSPIIQGHSYILVPQDLTGTIFIASTPQLVEKTIGVLTTIETTSKIKVNEQIFIYQLVNISYQQAAQSLKMIIEKLLDKGYNSSSTLITSLESIKQIPENNSILFTGTAEDILKIKEIMQGVDTPQAKSFAAGAPTYFLYKLKNVWGNIIEDHLDELSSTLQKQGITDPSLLEVIESAKWIKETNSILLTGNASAIEEAKEIIAKYDMPKDGASKDNFFIYRPQSVPASELEKLLVEMGHRFEESGLADAALLETIFSMKYLQTSNSLIFTGTQDSIAKLKTILQDIDTPHGVSGIQTLGKTHFFIYTIKHSPGPKIIAAIHNLAEEISKSSTSDKELLQTLKSVRYSKDTNTLIFTGSVETLEKVKPLVEKFDADLKKKELSKDGTLQVSYFVYKPQYLTGDLLKQELLEFTENLKTTGVEKPDLFDAINLMNWNKKTNTLVFSGSEETIAEIQSLIKLFDIPGKAIPTQQDETISIDDLGFLVYKLQFHKGDEIQNALKLIAKEITTDTPNATDAHSKIIKSINSIQWIQVTNSIICSGDEQTLAKLKELIKSLDLPLKQVFIEMLVIQTSLNNALTFGLDWGSKFQYKNKLASGMSNVQPEPQGQVNPFATTFNTISNTKFPKGSDILSGQGFDLGIIGDILMHKGQSFLSLGSLLQALQDDQETTIVMTPKIITQDGKTSTIFIGNNIPYVGSSIANQSTNTLVTTNLEYRDIGMNLTLTPYLGNSETVTLTIDLESTSDTGSVNFGNAGVQGITTSKTSMNTSVHVPSKNFLVLSGMVQDTKTRVKSGIPCLGGLPFIGAAFSRNNNQDSKNNIVIFIRPHIINSYSEMINITENEENYFREQAGSPALERDVNESLELIKSYEDE